MIIFKKITLVVLFFLFINLNSHSISEIYIKYKIEDKIITNIDIKDEAKYLLALNSQLKNIDKNQLAKISEQSIIRETIKKIELLKYFVINIDNPLLDSIIKDFYVKLNLKNIKEFEAYLKAQNLEIGIIKKKIAVEATWNKLIYDKYNSQVNIDMDELKKRIGQQAKMKNKKLINLSEIIFERSQKSGLEEQSKKIFESIKEIGFKNTANIYSISSSAKFGGSIGWIQERNLSEEIIKTIKNMKPGELSKPININNSFLILKINDIKQEKKIINKKVALEKLINFEQNKQLEQFSKIHFNKVKINIRINEL